MHAWITHDAKSFIETGYSKVKNVINAPNCIWTGNSYFIQDDCLQSDIILVLHETFTGND